MTKGYKFLISILIFNSFQNFSLAKKPQLPEQGKEIIQETIHVEEDDMIKNLIKNSKSTKHQELKIFEEKEKSNLSKKSKNNHTSSNEKVVEHKKPNWNPFED